MVVQFANDGPISNDARFVGVDDFDMKIEISTKSTINIILHVTDIQSIFIAVKSVEKGNL